MREVPSRSTAAQEVREAEVKVEVTLKVPLEMATARAPLPMSVARWLAK